MGDRQGRDWSSYFNQWGNSSRRNRNNPSAPPTPTNPNQPRDTNTDNSDSTPEESPPRQTTAQPITTTSGQVLEEDDPVELINREQELREQLNLEFTTYYRTYAD